MNDWRDGLEHVMILGLGASGLAAARLALRLGLRTEVRDQGEGVNLQETAAQLRRQGAEVRLGSEAMVRPGRVPDLVVASPGIAPGSPLRRMVRGLDRPLVGELEFGAGHCASPLLAVTGSNGKTTTVELTVHCLRQAGLAAVAAGNIGVPLCQVALETPAPPVVVLEVSSFQLETIDRLRVRAAAYLNLSEDHLDRYPDFMAYAEAKARICQTVERADQLILRDDLVGQAALAPRLRQLPGRPLIFSSRPEARERADYFVGTGNELCRRRENGCGRLVLARADELKMQGGHNLENALAAVALCERFGIDPAVAAAALASFEPAAHRLRTVFVRNRIRVVDDSKATNPDALIRALQALAEPGRKNIVLIAGGLDKKMDFSPVKPWLANAVKHVVCIGECRNRLAAIWGGQTVCDACDNFAEAVAAAVASAESGDTVLLSPGCASQDMFADYVERGRMFIDLISKEMEK